MERAGQAAFASIQRRWPQAQRILVLCGGGNNGGDGYVIASLARRAGKDVTVIHVGDRYRLAGDALAAMQQALAAQVPMYEFDGLTGSLPPTDLIVDALLGTGFRGDLRDDFRAAIGQVNAAHGAAGVPVLAIDIPSGLCADTGAVRGPAVQADATITFIGLKRGLFTARGPALCGAVEFDGLRVPREVYACVEPCAQRIDATLATTGLPARARDAHKGDFGHVLVIGGDFGYAGAALMAAEAAARCGAGLVSLATRPEHLAACTTHRPEIMAHGIRQPAEVEPLLARATVVVVGPGLGRSAWARGLLAQALATGLPLVVDADALNLLAAGDVVPPPARRTDPRWILTPHPGEAARLLGSDTAGVQADRYAAARSLQSHYGGTVLLKGAGTLVDDGLGPVAVATVGNPGMASGGMGDVLAGILGGLLAQGLDTGEAARLGAVLHGAAADRAARRQGERGLLATDLLVPLRELLNARAGDDATH
ncbi:MAG: NAD(P)H-hydrate dehydratase, partial [Gammaproteobacteria bacterium]